MTSRVCIISVLILALCGCTHNVTDKKLYLNSTTKGAAAGAVTGAVVGSFIPPVGTAVGAAAGAVAGSVVGYNYGIHTTDETVLERRLTAAGIQRYSIGDKTVMVLPAKYFFYGRSPRFFECGAETLQHVVTYINAIDVSQIYVNGYTDSKGSDIRNLALSKERAVVVADLLEHYGLTDRRLLVAEGYGPAKPIVDNRDKGRRFMNNRIEIVAMPVIG